MDLRVGTWKEHQDGDENTVMFPGSVPRGSYSTDESGLPSPSNRAHTSHVYLTRLLERSSDVMDVALLYESTHHCAED